MAHVADSAAKVVLVAVIAHVSVVRSVRLVAGLVVTAVAAHLVECIQQYAVTVATTVKYRFVQLANVPSSVASALVPRRVTSTDLAHQVATMMSVQHVHHSPLAHLHQLQTTAR